MLIKRNEPQQHAVWPLSASCFDNLRVYPAGAYVSHLCLQVVCHVLHILLSLVQWQEHTEPVLHQSLHLHTKSGLNTLTTEPDTKELSEFDDM